ncbi:MAG: PhzF family phenazine biosynthesis protein [Alphaproteobacteria bacterium]|nr:PhzF family phenazine biosynthesis protein [Alphaproteobacteria bacterium]
MKVWMVDAFATKPYTGNPAGVIIVSEFPEDEKCLKIAAEINLSETAFVKPLSKDYFQIRWFTPSVEVKLCGHATLAASHILFQEKIISTNEIKFTSLSGDLTVTREADFLVLNFPLQKTGPSLPVEPLIELLDLTSPVIGAVQALDDVILELKYFEDVNQLSLDSRDVEKVDCRGLIITAKGDKSYDFISRFFAPREGINEDPVTGSAHCKLAHYWQNKLKKDTFLAYQASERGGEIHITINKERVLLKGKALTVMEGDWRV